MGDVIDMTKRNNMGDVIDMTAKREAQIFSEQVSEFERVLNSEIFQGAEECFPEHYLEELINMCLAEFTKHKNEKFGKKIEKVKEKILSVVERYSSDNERSFLINVARKLQYFAEQKRQLSKNIE